MVRIKDLVGQGGNVVVAANAHQSAVGFRRRFQQCNGRIEDCIVADINLDGPRRVQRIWNVAAACGSSACDVCCVQNA